MLKTIFYLLQTQKEPIVITNSSLCFCNFLVFSSFIYWTQFSKILKFSCHGHFCLEGAANKFASGFHWVNQNYVTCFTARKFCRKSSVHTIMFRKLFPRQLCPEEILYRENSVQESSVWRKFFTGKFCPGELSCTKKNPPKKVMHRKIL